MGSLVFPAWGQSRLPVRPRSKLCAARHSWSLRMDTERHSSPRPTVAILSRGDAVARRDATAQNSRFVRIYAALAAHDIEAYPVIYDESFADAVRAQLLSASGVRVWVDPIHQGKTRVELDPLLRDVAARGPWVSAHPD